MAEDRPRELGVNDLITFVRNDRTWRRYVIRLQQTSSGLLEFGRLLISRVFWTIKVPRGDGHSVLVIPGYGVGDLHMTPIRYWLKRAGYTPVRSGISANPGWSEQMVEALGRRAEDEFRSSGRRVTLIGHSLGALQSHSLAERRPHIIRQVIALGAGFIFAAGTILPSVPIASIYTSMDLPYEPKARESHAENIQVRGTHNGLAVSREVYQLLAGLLARPDSSAVGS
jgi:pimeloyl-ACP methyl ester carboxylesterase